MAQDHPLIGKVVRYYLNGWRVGYLKDVKPRKKQAQIQPIGGNKRSIWVSLEGIEEAG